jgi:hypothetical protein
VRGFHSYGSTKDKLSPENTKQSKSIEISSNVNILQASTTIRIKSQTQFYRSFKKMTSIRIAVCIGGNICMFDS